MTPLSLDRLLPTLRRHLTLLRVLRIALLGGLTVLLVWSLALPGPAGRWVLAGLGLLAVSAWMMFVAAWIRQTRDLQAGTLLLTLGRLDDAENRLGRSLMRFTLSARAKLIVGQQLAALFFRRERHADVVALCRELLRHRLAGIQNVWINTRLLLADSLLLMDQVADAYAAIRPVYDMPLSLADRMKLLPLQLRYELASDHAESAVGALAEKVRVAELLDSPRAALVHALLAEACRRRAMPVQQAFLTERARLYHDLEDLAERYPVISPVVGSADR